MPDDEASQPDMRYYGPEEFWQKKKPSAVYGPTVTHGPAPEGVGWTPPPPITPGPAPPGVAPPPVSEPPKGTPPETEYEAVTRTLQEQEAKVEVSRKAVEVAQTEQERSELIRRYELEYAAYEQYYQRIYVPVYERHVGEQKTKAVSKLEQVGFTGSEIATLIANWEYIVSKSSTAREFTQRWESYIGQAHWKMRLEQITFPAAEVSKTLAGQISGVAPGMVGGPPVAWLEGVYQPGMTGPEMVREWASGVKRDILYSYPFAEQAEYLRGVGTKVELTGVLASMTPSEIPYEAYKQFLAGYTTKLAGYESHAQLAMEAAEEIQKAVTDPRNILAEIALAPGIFGAQAVAGVASWIGAKPLPTVGMGLVGQVTSTVGFAAGRYLPLFPLLVTGVRVAGEGSAQLIKGASHQVAEKLTHAAMYLGPQVQAQAAETLASLSITGVQLAGKLAAYAPAAIEIYLTYERQKAGIHPVASSAQAVFELSLMYGVGASFMHRLTTPVYQFAPGAPSTVTELTRRGWVTYPEHQVKMFQKIERVLAVRYGEAVPYIPTRPTGISKVLTGTDGIVSQWGEKGELWVKSFQDKYGKLVTEAYFKPTAIPKSMIGYKLKEGEILIRPWEQWSIKAAAKELGKEGYQAVFMETYRPSAGVMLAQKGAIEPSWARFALTHEYAFPPLTSTVKEWVPGPISPGHMVQVTKKLDQELLSVSKFLQATRSSSKLLEVEYITRLRNITVETASGGIKQAIEPFTLHPSLSLPGGGVGGIVPLSPMQQASAMMVFQQAVRNSTLMMALSGREATENYLRNLAASLGLTITREAEEEAEIASPFFKSPITGPQFHLATQQELKYIQSNIQNSTQAQQHNLAQAQSQQLGLGQQLGLVQAQQLGLSQVQQLGQKQAQQLSQALGLVHAQALAQAQSQALVQSQALAQQLQLAQKLTLQHFQQPTWPTPPVPPALPLEEELREKMMGIRHAVTRTKPFERVWKVPDLDAVFRRMFRRRR